MNIVTPEVTLIASTYIEVSDNMKDDALSRWMETRPEFTAAEMLTEFSGRSCYESFDRPNPATADTGDYLRRTLFEQAHWSIAEHASATFYITGVSRALTHELIRHRHLSYSQVSQRFVNEEDTNIVVPPAIRDLEEKHAKGASMFDFVTNADQVTDAVDGVAEETAAAYKNIVGVLTDSGLPRKQAREAARAVLPNCTETKIVVTGNLRAWEEVTKRRTAPDADAEIREVMQMVRDKLYEVAPNIFPKDQD